MSQPIQRPGPSPAGTLKKVSRPFDHMGRFGGEEFIVILNDSGLSKALAYGERVRSEIEHLGNLLSDRFPGLKLTVSIGLSKYGPDIEDQETLILKADQALYRAKNAGRNRVETSWGSEAQTQRKVKNDN